MFYTEDLDPNTRVHIQMHTHKKKLAVKATTKMHLSDAQ